MSKGKETPKSKKTAKGVSLHKAIAMGFSKEEWQRANGQGGKK